MPEDNRVLAAFDFDGTISTQDTFFPFLLYVCGRRAVYRELAYSLADLLRPAGERSLRDRLKASLVRRLFRGLSREYVEARARDYAQTVLGSKLRPRALERIRWHKEQGHRCVLVSASLDVYLEPIAGTLGFDDLLCTRLGRAEGILDGELLGANCRRAEKVRRLASLVGNLSRYHIYAYGDSAGDRELLEIAAEKHFRPFA